MASTAERSPLQPGARFLKYETSRLLGRGGHACVYEGYDSFLDRRVAIKLIGNPPHSRADLGRRAQMEARVLCRIDHPNVVKVLDAGATDAGVVYIIMELLEGASLRAALRSVHRLTVAEALHIGWQIAEATEAAHAHGVVHRDLKPENVFVQADNRVKVLDFGIAKFVKETSGAPTTERHVFHGTLVYMSPEHLQTAAVTPQSDIYALGTILYELLAGLAPCYIGIENPEIGIRELAAVQITRVPPRLDTINADVPPAVASAVARMLAKTAAQRFCSMREVATTLRQLAKDFAVTEAGMATPVRSLWRLGEPPLERLPIVARREEIVRAHAAECEVTLVDPAALGSATTAEPAAAPLHSTPAPALASSATPTTVRASPRALGPASAPARATLRLGSLARHPEAAPPPAGGPAPRRTSALSPAPVCEKTGTGEPTDRGVATSAQPRFAVSRVLRTAVLGAAVSSFALLSLGLLWHGGQNHSAVPPVPLHRADRAASKPAELSPEKRPQSVASASASVTAPLAEPNAQNTTGPAQPVGAQVEIRAQQRLTSSSRGSRTKSRTESTRATRPLALSGYPSAQKPEVVPRVAATPANSNDRGGRSRATEAVQPLVPSRRAVQALPSAGLDP